jgi:hypothetical protein
MLFRRRASSSPQNIITAQFPNPKSTKITPGNVAISHYPPPQTPSDALSLSNPSCPPLPPLHRSLPRQPLDRSQSSEYFLEIRKNSVPQSYQTNEGMIHTDATSTQPAFSSDAFAIQMPTTREPILDTPIYRAKLPGISKAQVDAYQTYKEKAKLVRERNNSEGVRVPSKILSYDYGYGKARKGPGVHPSPPHSPTKLSVAGSYPTSPPLEQEPWIHTQDVGYNSSRHRSTTASSNISITRKPIAILSTPSTTPTRTRYQAHASDTSPGASTCHPSTPPKLKLLLKPQAVPTTPSRPPRKNLYTHSPPSTASSRSSSPEKPERTAFSTRAASPEKTGARFAYTTTGAEAEKKEAVPLFAATRRDAAKKKREEKEREREKVGRWTWLRPTGTRVGKLGLTPTTITSTTTITTPRPLPDGKIGYIDPFTQHSPPPPMVSRSPSPRKLQPLASKRKVDSGFAQISSLGLLIAKVCLVVYLLVGVYFVLDAVREAVHVLGAPVRGVRRVVGVVF